ncbi:uncharacterized protein B0H64DRAFT_17036 [Chaetomium fimeti]|uniref:DOMON domain-containing protein n=1 Tax=Chaetomium fimeti TaxID=1854472 RepID=A0AAE0HPT8_9PEZI|nr:hypothetical protein B0H64DRAFT_17036 [Chaetomium fimeti]
MRSFGWLLSAVSLLGADFAVADPAQFCPSGAGGLCYSVAVPTSSADAGSGNIYFQIKAPTSLQWAALGTGTGMTDSSIFLMYQDGNGNVTLSPRLGTGHSEPKLDTSSTAAKLTLLAGSGVSDDGSTMTANVACSNCQSWTGGEMSLQSTSAAWISAWKSGSSLASTDKAATISYHDDRALFNIDLTTATVSSDANPFVQASSDGNGDGSGSGSGGGDGGDTGVGGGGSSGGITQAAIRKPTILVAHGIIMALVFVLFYPLGSVIMPLVGKWWFHAAWQAVAFCLMWAGFALGFVTGERFGMLWNEPHLIFGTVVVSLLGIQPIFGILHHLHYVKAHHRGVISYVHIWWGRILMALGVINGGLGLRLAREDNGPIIAYGTIAGVVYCGYLAYKVYRFLGHVGPAVDKEENREMNEQTHA